MSFFFPDPQPEPARLGTVREAAAIDPDLNQDQHLYRRYGTAQRDLLGYALNRAQNLSVHTYRSNPLANRIIKIHTTYMAGHGFALTCRNPEVQAVAEEFWNAPRNQLHINHRPFARDFLLFGEGIHPVGSDDAGTGATTVGFIDPTCVERIDRHPYNNMILDQIVLEADAGRHREPLKIITSETNPLEDDAGLMIGDTFAWLHDRIGGASRGTPFLLPTLDWLDAYDQTIWELLERVKAVRAFFWNVKVQGGDDEVQDAKRIWGTTPPKSGSVRFMTDAMDVEAAQPQIGVVEDAAAARLILRHIAAGAGVAPHWLGDPEDANRSTAESMDAPVLRSLADIQETWKTQTEDMIRYAVDRKVAAGMLPRLLQPTDNLGNPAGDIEPARNLVQTQLPSITDDDIVAAAGALTSVAQAFLALDTAGYGDPNLARQVIRQILPSLGVPADELPDPDADADDRIAMALESITREAARGKLDALLTELAEVT